MLELSSVFKTINSYLQMRRAIKIIVRGDYDHSEVQSPILPLKILIVICIYKSSQRNIPIYAWFVLYRPLPISCRPVLKSLPCSICQAPYLNQIHSRSVTVQCARYMYNVQCAYIYDVYPTFSGSKISSFCDRHFHYLGFVEVTYT